MAEFKGTREAFAAALYEMAAENDKVVGVFPDSLKAMRAVPFGETYPDRYIECGIAEQCAVDVAAGLASAGMLPFVGTYCGFLTMRAGEQMRTFVGYTDLNVKFIGVNAGILGGEREGVTHQFYEDLAFVTSIPNFTVLTPADPEQLYEAVKYAAELAVRSRVRYISVAAADVKLMYMQKMLHSPKMVSPFGKSMAQMQYCSLMVMYLIVYLQQQIC